MNCLTRELAREACAARGLRLPTEAEWEYAAGNGTRETSFPWGEDGSVCEHAVVARAPLGSNPNLVWDSTCLSQADVSPVILPVIGGHPKDVTLQGVKNLAGNLAEIVDDEYAPYDAPCWGTGVLLRNPRCNEAASTDFSISVRGSAWPGFLLSAQATARGAIQDGRNGSAGVGFRCARSAE